ncbi:peptidoglycan-binding protein [Patescibacteria group bacterium]|nr:peptidoglycan-binding protein [Patescibacteria group bacterium]
MMFKRAILIAAFMLVLVPSSALARTMSIGMSGDDITNLQNILISQNFLAAGNNVGTFGPATLTAVKKFQCQNKITCSGSSYGVVGPKTQAALRILNTDLSTAASAANTKPLEFGGWIPYWHATKGTADVLPHLSQLAHISPFQYTVTSSGLVTDAGDINAEPWTSFIKAAKAKGVRVIPTVMWGDGDAEHAVLSDAKKRVAMEDQIAALVKAQGFDGIDIDFEAKKAETKDYFSTFLKGLYQRMGNKWVYCSIEARMPLEHRYGIGATPPAGSTEYANDYAAINKYCDRVQIMAYDQGSIDTLLNGSRAQPYVPVADPTWVETIVSLAAQSIDRKKILIGVPTYGYEYKVTSSGSGYQYKLQWAFNQNYATQLASLLGVTPSRNSANELSFMYKSTAQTQSLSDQASVPGSVAAGGNTVLPPTDVYTQSALATSLQPPFNIVWWSDSKAIADKVALAKKLGVRGVSVFKFDGSEDPNIWNVLK